MALFSFFELTNKFCQNQQDKNNKTDLSKSAAIIEKYEGMHFKKIEGLRDLMGDTPAAGEIYFLWTQNQFNAVTFILYIIRNFSVIDCLIFSTYAINERIVNSLAKWYDSGAVRQVTIFISDTVSSGSKTFVSSLTSRPCRRSTGGWPTAM